MDGWGPKTARECSAHSRRRFTNVQLSSKRAAVACLVPDMAILHRTRVELQLSILYSQTLSGRRRMEIHGSRAFIRSGTALSVPVREQDSDTVCVPPNEEPLRERLMQRGSSESVSLVFSVNSSRLVGNRRLSRSDLHELLHICSSVPPPKIAWI